MVLLNKFIKKTFFKNKTNFIILVLYSLILFFLLYYIIYIGPNVSSDSINYIEMALKVKNNFFPYSNSLSPGYPFLIGITSNFFNISIGKSLILLQIIFLVISLYFVNKIVKLIILKNDKYRHRNLFITFFIFFNWSIINIITAAHADNLLFLVIILYFYFMYLWTINNSIRWYFICVLLGAISIWIKLNGLVLIPFIVIIYIFKNIKSINYYFLFIPIFIMILSFKLFKKVNGCVIDKLNTFEVNDFLSFFSINKLLLINFSDSGKVFFSIFFTKTICDKVSFYFGIILMIVFLSFFLIYVIKSKFKINKNNIFLLFSIFYWISIFTMEKYFGNQEINTRTLFPSIISMFLWIIFCLKENNKIIIFIFFINIFYSFYYIHKLYKRDRYDTFSYINEFENKKSFCFFNDLKNKYNITDSICTNEPRCLLYATNYSIKISKYPSNKFFDKGKVVQMSKMKYEEIHFKFCKNFKKNRNLIYLVNKNNLNSFDSLLLNKNSKIFKVENDLIILSK